MTNIRVRFALATALIMVALVAIPQARAMTHHLLRAVGVERAQRQLRTGDALVPLKLYSLNGDRVAVSNDGRPQIINVFATWCTECKAETPALAQAAAALRSSGVQLIGIDQAESEPVVTQFAQSNGLRYPIYLDRDGSVTHAILGARFIPTTIVVDKRGIIRFEHIGPLTRADFAALAEAVRNAG
ncbi:MAG TPA: TlpA disulfide reductase family protein [Candidatus Baltobacteraceae bacterium]|jgi:thiol-disulfide isomerase/thioredoxin|nr:TlpA disulfide reductase family protein [Candidatus Baltobacteraceae bacterium]